MGKKHGPWTIEGTVENYRDEFIEFYVDSVIKPDGERGTFAVARMPRGVSVLALDEDGFVHLTKEFRYAIGRESVEVVSGAIDEGEEAREAARRELREELGIEAEELIELGTVDAITSQAFCPVELFLARGLEFGEAQREGTEKIERVRMRFEDAVEDALESRITHAPSCVLILKAEKHLSAVRGA